MNRLIAVVVVLSLSVFAHAQYLDLGKSANIGNGANVIRPKITNQYADLGANYTLGSEVGNLTGNYGAYMTFKFAPLTSENAFVIALNFYNADGTAKEVDIDRNGTRVSEVLDIADGVTSTSGAAIQMDFVMVEEFFSYDFEGGLGIPRDPVPPYPSECFAWDALGGFVDYFAVSGSGQAKLTNFQIGGVRLDDRVLWWNPLFTDLRTLRGFGNGLDEQGQGVGAANWTGTIDFNNVSYRQTTWSSGSLNYNLDTGFAMKGKFATGTIMGGTWDNLTYTFGSFERVSEVPEPGTLLLLGIAAIALPFARGRKKNIEC
ncbi:MAG: PEP-CTERM sorting domain-containing protein [Thermoguttaceae bacterium]